MPAEGSVGREGYNASMRAGVPLASVLHAIEPWHDAPIARQRMEQQPSPLQAAPPGAPAVPQQAPRKRGRPRKHPVVTEQPSNQPPPPKRKRGRPRKHPLPDLADGPAAGQQAATDALAAAVPESSTSQGEGQLLTPSEQPPAAFGFHAASADVAASIQADVPAELGQRAAAAPTAAAVMPVQGTPQLLARAASQASPPAPPSTRAATKPRRRRKTATPSSAPPTG